jgi:chromate reductase
VPSKAIYFYICILLIKRSVADKIKILAISGSTRKSSSNLNLIKAITNLTAEIFTVKIFEGLAALPHFNPDLDNEEEPEQVRDFKRELRQADGVLICTPEYAIGVPGTLKNAVDWTVSTMEFSQKPVALITASTSGYVAHQSLLGTLLIIEAKITKESQTVISAVRTKVNEHSEITDEETRGKIDQLVQSLAGIITGAIEQDYLPAPLLKF